MKLFTKLDLDEINTRLANLYGDVLSVDLANYNSMRDKVVCTCNKCGRVWNTTLLNLMKGYGCVECSKNELFEKHKETINNLFNNTIEVDYTGYEKTTTKLNCHCKTCGRTWQSSVANLIRGRGCAVCRYKNKAIIEVEEVMCRIKETCGDTITVDYSEYKNTVDKLPCHCNICGHDWYTSAGNLYRGKNGCPNCDRLRKIRHVDDVKKDIEEIHKGKISVDYSTYKTRKSKCTCTCKICGHVWESSFSNVLNGCGCKKCAIKAKSFPIEYVDSVVKEKHPSLEIVLDNYESSKSRVQTHCKVCGHDWEPTVRSLLKGHGCSVCGHTKNRLSVTEVQERLEDIHGNSIKVDLTKYESTLSKVTSFCNVCGTKWETLMSHLLNGTGCPTCAVNRNKKTVDDVLHEIKEVHGDSISMDISSYKSTREHAIFHCNVCGHVWETYPSDVYRGTGCAKCSIKQRTTSVEQCIEKLYKIHGDKYEYDFSTYTALKDKIKVTCKSDGYVWYPSVNSLLEGHGCAVCNLTKYEKPIYDILVDKGVSFSHNKGELNCLNPKTGGQLRYDFKIPADKPKLLIEVDGCQHFQQIRGTTYENLENIEYRDSIKNKFAKDNGLILIRASDYRHRDPKHISMNKLKYLLEEYTKDGVVDVEAFRPYDFNRE